jgi:hypothetical protein
LDIAGQVPPFFDRFRPFFPPGGFEIRSMNQGSDRFTHLPARLKNGENGENRWSAP